MVDPRQVLTPEIIQTELDTKEKQQKVAMDLQVLQAQPGWIFIERVLRKHIAAMGEQILEGVSLDPETEKDMKRERAFLKLFKELPGAWVAELMHGDIQTKDTNDDPFHFPELQDKPLTEKDLM